MLGKLLKYEFKRSWLEFVVTFAILIALSALYGAIFRFIDAPILIAMFIMIYVTSLMSIGIVYIINLYRSLWTRMYGAEGQLYLTLPVTTDQLLLSKLIANFIWAVASGLVILLSVAIIILIADAGNYLLTLFEIEYVWMTLLPLLISTVYTLLLAIFVISTVNIGFLKNNRILAAIILMIVLSSIIDVVLQFAIIFPFGIVQEEGIMHFGVYSFSDMTSGRLVQSYNTTFIKLLLSFAYYFITRYLLKKQLSYVTP